MKVLDLVQGSPEWHAHRATARNASEAPIIMPGPSNTTRSEFVRIKHSGEPKDISAFLQKIFDRGHEVEPALRAYAEGIIYDDLYPICGVSDDGFFSASFDGVTASHRIMFEGKQPNKEKRAHIEANGTVPPVDYWQVVHQFAANEKAELCIYAVGDGTQEGTVHLEVRREDIAHDIPKLRAGWLQFEQDVENYQHVETPVAPVVEVHRLPALSVRLVGSVEVISNLPEFREELTNFIARINMAPEDDQGFAEAEAAIKVLESAQGWLASEKARALSQIAAVDEMVRTTESIDDLARKTRLALEKMVKSRKDEIRADIATKARMAWMEHVNALNAKLGRVRITVPAPDFAGAMKGKRKLDPLRAAVGDALAAAKIAANQQADAFAANLAIIDEIAKDHQFFVRDIADLMTVNPAHLPGILKGRIAEHEAEQQRKLEEERARIRREEEARAQRDAERKAEQERQRIREEEQAKARAEAEERAKQERAAQLEAAARTGETVTVDAKPGEIIELPKGVKPNQVVVNAQPAAPTLTDIGKPRRATSRPTDAEIIEVLALHFRVHESKVVEWLCEMDLSALEVVP
jgi:predicted phage-related endonuclease